VKFYIVSDKTEARQATLRARLMDFEGKVLLEESKAVDVTPLASKDYLDWPLKNLTAAGAADTSRVFIVADLSEGGAEISRNLVYLAPTKEIHLKPAVLKVETTGGSGNFKIRVNSPVLARSVYLSFGNLDVQVSDNYFDLLPGETVEIGVTSGATLDALKAQMKVVSLTDAFKNNDQPATLMALP
jgi:beta-mannosidase